MVHLRRSSRCMAATACATRPASSADRWTTGDGGSQLPGLSYCFLTAMGHAGLHINAATRRRKFGRTASGSRSAARDWLQQQDFTRKDRISLLGWANGGIAALWAVRPNLEPGDDRPDFRSAVALYPGCRRLGETAWSTRIPTLILIGALDEWTPAKPCEQMVRGARERPPSP